MLNTGDLVRIKTNRFKKWNGCYAMVIDECFPYTKEKWYEIELNAFTKKQFMEIELEKV